MTTSPAHRPFEDQSQRVQGSQYAVRCEDCAWTQIIDEDLHEHAVGALLAWHTQNPDHQVDHLAGPAPGRALAVPGYVRWMDVDGRLALLDQRTEGYYNAYNQECLAIMESVDASGALASAVAATAVRLEVRPSRVRKEVHNLAEGLYQKGLLQPAPEAG